MITYSWAHPLDKTMEQANTAEEARLRVWQSLRPVLLSPSLPCMVQVWEQEPVATIWRKAWNITDPTPWPNGYAWVGPSNGERLTASDFTHAVAHIRKQMEAASPSIEPVLLYRQRQAFQVRHDEPKPKALKPEDERDDTPESLIRECQDGARTDAEWEAHHSHAQTLALLWIAQALQKIAYPFGNTDNPEVVDVPRPVNAQQPHNFIRNPSLPNLCAHCFRPQKHAIHGYTGD